MADSLRQQLDRRRAELEADLNSFIPHYRDITDYLSPRTAKFLVDEKSLKGNKKNDKIINETATNCLEILKSGMHAGMTSPARPWFRFTTDDPDLMEYTPVKEYLYDVEERMRLIFVKSNIYNSFPTIYGSLGGYGTAAMGLYEDSQSVIRTYTLPVGSYMLSLDDRLRVDTIYRKIPMTVRQVVMMFGDLDRKSGSINWDNISRTVRNLWDSNKRESIVEVIQAVEPNLDRDPSKLNAKDKPFRSVYFEQGGTEDKVLRESGFDEFPFMCPRWDVFAEDDVYGYAPGMLALGSIKQLQLMERRDDEAIEKKVRPPMLGDTSLRTQRTSILPGDITYIDNLAASQHAGFRPVYQVEPKTAELNVKIERIERRIREIFHTDLMLMFAQSDRAEITAEEVRERHQEKLLVLGPVLERQNPELFNPIIDRTYAILNRRGMLPPPPRELEEKEFRVEYTSIMAQAQRLIGTASVERVVGFVGNLAAASGNPDVWDKVDLDQTIDEYANMHGSPPRIIRSDDAVVAIREKRQQAQQAQLMAERSQPMNQLASAAKTLSETNVEETSALSRLLGV